MRLTPIEKPRHLMTRRAYSMMKQRFGKVPTPIKVIYGRKPAFLPLLMLINRIENHSISLDDELRLLVFNQVDRLNGCSFCDDYRLAIVVQKKIGVEKFGHLAQFRTSDLFSARERAALAYAEEATASKQVSDETFEDVKKHFSEVEIVELTWLVAVENYFNLLKLSLELGGDGLRALAEDRVQVAPTARAAAT